MTEKDVKLKKGVFNIGVLGYKDEWIEVVGYLAQVPSFFGVYKDNDSDWILTHLPSGLAVCSPKTLTQARRIIVELMAMGKWNRSAKEIMADKDFCRSVEEIVRR